jgi:putative ABC transport system permease protein
VRWIIRVLIACTIGLFAWVQSGDWRLSLSFLVGIGATLGILALTGSLLIWLVRRFFPKNWSYVWRQGVANLFRPKNQTTILMVSIGLGTFLVATLFFVQDLLLSQISFAGGQNQPNMILFDIQSSQKDSVAALTKSFDLPVLQEVPIVTMKLESLKGVSRLEHSKDTSSEIRNWVYDREWRVTYRDTLIDTETIVEGTWYGQKQGDTIFVSVAKNVAEDMQVKPGDQLTFNVQGAMVKTYVGSIREVNFRRIQTNFLILFPRGVLEAAPQFNVIITKVPSEEKSARFQQALVQQYPNISAIDLTQILRTVDDVLSKVSFVIRFMAVFSILTGLLVLLTSVMLSRLQRVRESVLLRTLGASKRQILQINALEYLLLGFFATSTGILLATVASYLLAKFVFEAPFAVIWWPALVLMAIIIGIILLTGLSSIRRIVRQSPLEVLRNEV